MHPPSALPLEAWTLLGLHPRLLLELLRQGSDISKLLVFLLLESLSGALNHLYFSKISGVPPPSLPPRQGLPPRPLQIYKKWGKIPGLATEMVSRPRQKFHPGL